MFEEVESVMEEIGKMVEVEVGEVGKEKEWG